jgi:HEAT repeat protein
MSTPFIFCLMGGLFSLLNSGQFNPAAPEDTIIEGKSIQEWLKDTVTGDSCARKSAIEALNRYCSEGTDGIKMISRALENMNEEVRIGAARFLRERDNQDVSVAIPILQRAFKKEKSEAVRKAFVLTLGALGGDDRDVLSVLLGALKEDKDAEIRASAAFSIRCMKPKPTHAIPVLEEALNDKEASVRVEVAHALARIGDPEKVARALLEGLKNEKERTVESFAVALSQIGSEAVPLIRNALANKDGKIRGGAVLALGYMKRHNPETGEAVMEAKVAVIDLLKDKEPFVRRSAVEALGFMGWEDEATLKAILDVVDDKDGDVRCRSVLILESIGVEKQGVEDALIKLLKDPAPFVRTQAARALKHSKGAVPALIEALKDEDVIVRRCAVVSLGEIGIDAKSALPAVRGLLKDKDSQVRDRAAEAVKKIGGDDDT